MNEEPEEDGEFETLEPGDWTGDSGHAVSYQFVQSTGELRSRYEAGEREFFGAKLCGERLHAVDLSGIKLWASDLSRTDLDRAILRGADLSASDLSGAELHMADLSGAKLLGANLSGAHLKDASLEDANLRDVKGLRLDSTIIRNARFSPYAPDPWSILKRNYTGARFALHLLLLMTFLLPYVARTMLWVSVNQGQMAMLEVTARLQKAVEDLQAQPDPIRREDSAAPLLRRQIDRLSEVQPCLRPVCREWRVWQVVLGVDRGLRYAHLTVLAAMVLLYNILRGFLTWQVAPLREEEEQSGVSPSWRGARWWEGYRPLFWLHRLVTALYVVAAGSFLWHVYHWLAVSVWLPA